MQSKRGFALLEIILVVALVAVVITAVYLATNKPKPVATNTTTKTAEQPKDTVSDIKSTADIDTAIKENDAESTADVDSELSQIDQDLKDL